MKLDWKRAGCASIASIRGITFICEWSGENDRCDVTVRGVDGRLDVRNHQPRDVAAAEAYCEQWAETTDRPEWHDVNDWLSWAEWRGREVSIHTYAPVYGGSDRRWWVDISPRHTHGFDTLTEAKEYAEKWIRGQGAQ